MIMIGRRRRNVRHARGDMGLASCGERGQPEFVAMHMPEANGHLQRKRTQRQPHQWSHL
jgi:hypothetical protein